MHENASLWDQLKNWRSGTAPPHAPSPQRPRHLCPLCPTHFLVPSGAYVLHTFTGNCKQPAICGTNLQLLQPAGIRLTHWQNVKKSKNTADITVFTFVHQLRTTRPLAWTTRPRGHKKGVFLGPAAISAAQAREESVNVLVTVTSHDLLLAMKWASNVNGTDRQTDNTSQPRFKCTLAARWRSKNCTRW